MVSCSKENSQKEDGIGDFRENVRYVTATLSNYQFVPRLFHFNQGEMVEFNLVSEDGLHSFTIEQLGIDWVVEPEKVKIQRFTFTQAGKYKLICRIPPHDSLGMVGTVFVE